MRYRDLPPVPPERDRTGRPRGRVPTFDRRRGERRRPFPIERGGYRGRGEVGRYGDAPVPYGPEHTYDYHFGDRYGYGPDFRQGEERIRRMPPRRRRPPGYEPW